jgi:hypothetical protein
MFSFSLSDAEFDRDGKEHRPFGRSGIMPNREMGGNQIFKEGGNPEGLIKKGGTERSRPFLL